MDFNFFDLNLNTPLFHNPEMRKILYTILTIALFSLLNWLIKIIVNRKVKNLAARHKWRKIKAYLSFLVATVIIAGIWVDFQQFATFLGLLSAGIAIALREPLSNLLGWFFIVTRNPFSVGDRIEIDGTAGDVIDIRLFQFTLVEIGNWVKADQSTGRMIHIPNHKILSHELANYKADFSFIWNELPVMITFESNWEKAKEIIQEIINNQNQTQIEQARNEINRASSKYLIYFRKLTPIVYTSVEASGVLLTLRYLCRPQQRRSTETLIWEKILQQFQKTKDINLAYPTTRFYSRSEEGPVIKSPEPPVPPDLEK